MSHYNVTVILPPGTYYHHEGPSSPFQIVPSGKIDLEAALTRALHPYDENEPESPEHIDSKWDWWVIGGRWRGHFKVKTYSEDEQVETRPRYSDFDTPFRPGYCDGGRKDTLDFEGMREEAKVKAEADWHLYHDVVAGTPEALPWSDFYQRVEDAEIEVLGMNRTQACDAVRDGVHESLGFPIGEEYWDRYEEFAENLHERATQIITAKFREINDRLTLEARYDIEEARNDYGDQPRVQRVRNHPAYSPFDNPISEIGPYSLEEYTARKRAAAVPGYATLLVKDDGCTEWIAPGEMGWFGCSSDDHKSQDEYHRRINELIDAQPGDAYLVTIDCHI